MFTSVIHRLSGHFFTQIDKHAKIGSLEFELPLCGWVCWLDSQRLQLDMALTYFLK